MDAAPRPAIALDTWPSIRKSGCPLVGSLSVIVCIDRGNPRSAGLATFEPYHLMPIMWMSPPTYAGIALNRRSGPASNASAFCRLPGKVVTCPCMCSSGFPMST